MRALIYTDGQATDGHERCFTQPDKPLQLWRIEQLYKELLRIYEEEKCDALWDLGDTTDDRNAIPVSVIDTMCDSLESFDGKWNLKLVGNHEQFLRDTRIHAGKMFRHFFHVVDTCETIKCGKVNIFCISYHDDVNAIIDYLRRIPKTKPCVLIGHFQVVGCQMNSGVAATGIPREMLEFADVALLGHIHKPQTLASGNIHYVGSPFQQNWGESGESKRVAILDITDEGIELKWVPIKGFPRYIDVNFQEFCDRVKQDSEDRYRVVLSSIEETEKFYAHPLFNRADEATYAYENVPVAPVETAEEQAAVIPRGKRDILLKYMNRFPPAQTGVQLDDSTMLEFGESITNHL